MLWLGALAASPRAVRSAALTVTYAVVSVVMAMTMAVGSPHYRRGGEDAAVARVVELYPFVLELGVADRCTVEVHPDGESLDLVRRAKLGLTR